MAKKICVVIRGTGAPEVKDVELDDGSTVAELKEKLEVPASYQVLDKATGKFLKDNVDLCAVLQDGAKVELSPDLPFGM